MQDKFGRLLASILLSMLTSANLNAAGHSGPSSAAVMGQHVSTMIEWADGIFMFYLRSQIFNLADERTSVKDL